MKTKNINWELHKISRREEVINPKPQYQRSEGIWSERKQQLFMDSLLRGYDIPKIYLRVTEGEYDHEVVDGQQRLRTIWKFYKDEFALGDVSEDLPHGNLAGKRYSDFNHDTKDELNNIELVVVEIRDATDEEVRDLFLRLQEGESLTPAEKRNAMLGNMRDFVSDLAEHPVFKVVSKKNKRNLYDDWIAHVVCLEISGGSSDIKAEDLRKMYEGRRKFDKDSKEAKKIKGVLNYFKKSFDEETPEMDIKWGFVDYYFLISSLMDDYILINKEKEFGEFYIGFESNRRDADDPSVLIKEPLDGSNQDDWNMDLYRYIEAFTRSGGTKKSIEVRHEVYIKKALIDIPNLIPKDKRRSFDQNQRIVIWRRDQKQCKDCGKQIEFKEMHADHVKPHSKGGQTTIENGQALCGECNLKKGNK